MIMTDDSGNVTGHAGERYRRLEQAGNSAL